MLDFELNSIHLVRLSYKTRQRCKAIFHFLSESGFGDVKNGEKTNWNPLKKGFLESRRKKSVHFWCNFWDTKRAASVCISTTCGFLSAVRGGFENENQCATESIE